MTFEDKFEKTLKIIVLGSSEVGKTSILQRYFHNEFKENLLSTIGIDFKTKFFKFNGEKIKVNYTDTAGQEKFHAISVNYLKGTDGIILVYDITNKESFELLENWIESINENNRSDVGLILIGNKSDLKEERVVSEEEAKNFAKKNNCKYYEGSAKTGENIVEALDEIARLAYNYVESHPMKDERLSITISSDTTGKTNVEKKKCC